MIRAFACLILLCACVPDHPELAAPADEVYLCEDGTRIGVVYGAQAGQNSVTLSYNGETAVLLAEPAASGARYGWPSDGSGYIWWTKADQGTLYWKDGEKGGQETVLHSGCAAQ